MCLKGFCGYFSLYIGCLFIGLSGVILAVLIFSVSLFEMVEHNRNLVLEVGGMVFALIYCVGKIFLLFGVMWDVCWAILLAFFIGVVSFVLMVAVVVLFSLALPNPVYILLGSILIILELYYLWILISTWWCCRSCTQDC